VIEWNCRFGDPETQVVLARMAGDLLPWLEGAAAGRLAGRVGWRPVAFAGLSLSCLGLGLSLTSSLPLVGLGLGLFALGNFAGVTYYDGQGFLVRKALKVNSALELNGASICTQTGTTTELNLADFFRSNNMKYEVIAFGTADETVKAYESGRCDVFTTDVSQLYAEKLKLTNANDHVILPEIISKEPLGPLVRHGDDQWFDVVKWTLFAMLNAEELGISSKNVDEALKSNQPEIRRLLGVEGNFGEQLGLSKDWVVRIVKQVGNYGEVFERNVGTGSKLGISRGINRLWTKGGIQYAPPVR